MLGLSLVTVDGWIIAWLTSHENGLYAKLYFAKQLFTVPIAIVGQAAGAASMPFFVALLTKGERGKFAEAVNGSVTRILALSFLLSAWMMALSRPAVDLVLRGGALHRPEAATIAAFFALFSVSLCLWSAQAIYARAFYATGDTLSPMVASTMVTVLSVPIYWALYHAYGGTGLVIASNIGILAQTLVLAGMLHHAGLVRLSGLGWAEAGPIAGGSLCGRRGLRRDPACDSHARRLPLRCAGACSGNSGLAAGGMGGAAKDGIEPAGRSEAHDSFAADSRGRAFTARQAPIFRRLHFDHLHLTPVITKAPSTLQTHYVVRAPGWQLFRPVQMRLILPCRLHRKRHRQARCRQPNN